MKSPFSPETLKVATNNARTFQYLACVTILLTSLVEKIESFDLKSWVTRGTKIWPGIPSKERIFESKWLAASSQYNWKILQLLGIACRILVPPVIQLFRSKWLHFFFQWSALVSPSVRCNILYWLFVTYIVLLYHTFYSEWIQSFSQSIFKAIEICLLHKKISTNENSQSNLLLMR